MRVAMNINNAGFVLDSSRRGEFFRTSSDVSDLMNPESLYPESLNEKELIELGKKSGLARRIIKLMPSYCWRTELEVYEDLSAEDTRFEKAYKDLRDELKLQYHFRKVDILAGYGRFGVLFLGFDNSPDLSLAVEKRNGRKLKYIKALSEESVDIELYDTDPTSERYGLPIMYKITFEEEEESKTTKEVLIHWTRIIHVAETLEESEIFGQSRIAPIQFRVLDVERILGGSAAMFWRGGVSGVSFEADPEADLTADVEERLKKDIQDFVSGLNRFFFSQGVSANTISQALTDPLPYFEAQIKYISASLNIPYRFLIGSEEAKYASTQDRRSFYDQVQERREMFCVEVIVKPFIQRMLDTGVLPSVLEWDVQFQKDVIETEMEQMEYKALFADTLQKYSSSGLHNMIDFGTFLRVIMGLAEDAVRALETSYNSIHDGFEQNGPEDEDENEDETEDGDETETE